MNHPKSDSLIIHKDLQLIAGGSTIRQVGREFLISENRKTIIITPRAHEGPVGHKEPQQTSLGSLKVCL